MRWLAADGQVRSDVDANGEPVFGAQYLHTTKVDKQIEMLVPYHIVRSSFPP